MKLLLKIAGWIALFFVLLAIILTAFVWVTGTFFAKDPVISSLPKAVNQELCTSGGFGDFTDYGKYQYSGIEEASLLETGYFSKMDPSDVEEMREYLDNFEGRVESVGGEVQDGYDFDRSLPSPGDYLYLKTKEGEPIGDTFYRKFDNYTIYYFDFDAQTLYYFHSNI